MSNNFTAEFEALQAKRAAEAKEKADRLAEIQARYETEANQKKAEQELRDKEKKLLIEQQQQAKAAAAEQELKASALATWKAMGGGAEDADFEAAWPALKASLLSVKLQAEAQRQAAGVAQFYRERF